MPEQLRKSSQKGPPASLLFDIDSHTGGLMLARYAHALDRLDSGGVGRLNLRQPDTLQEIILVVQVVRHSIRVSITMVPVRFCATWHNFTTRSLHQVAI